jgi:hypothetical protein
METCIANPFYFPEQDAASLNNLFGRALLYDDVRQSLLCRDRRQRVLGDYALSFGTVKYMLELGDVDDLEDLATQVYDFVFRAR